MTIRETTQAEHTQDAPTTNGKGQPDRHGEWTETDPPTDGRDIGGGPSTDAARPRTEDEVPLVGMVKTGKQQGTG